ncbi:hypothetical protein OAA60_03160 [Porticoccaceae bacterium]|jgi:hypothetical protein|nr:hypothetical protein [Porticoccaceae bacterium]
MSFSLSTSAFSDFDGVISQEELDIIIDELDLSLSSSLVTLSDFVNILFQYFQDEASKNLVNRLIAPVSIISFLNVSSTNTNLFLCKSDQNSVFYNENINMAQTSGLTIYADVNQGQGITYNYDSTNSITLTHNMNDIMTLTGTGSTVGNFSQVVTPGNVINIDTHTQIYIGSLLIMVDESKYKEAASKKTKHHGIMPKPIHGEDRTHESFGNIRARLRNAWNTQYNSQLENTGFGLAQGLFRTVNNAGDLLSRRNIVNDKVGVPLATGQSNYVYNSSDYTRFKKEMAHSKNYNDITSGGGTSDNKKSIVFKI